MLGATELSDTFWQELEEILIQADLGISTSIPLINELKRISHSEGLTKGDQVFQQLRTLLIEHLKSVPEQPLDVRPLVAILVGVNGSGKTTTIARLAHRWLSSGHKVLLAAADTYRAAANEQLIIWGNRRQRRIQIEEGTWVDPGDFQTLYFLPLRLASQVVGVKRVGNPTPESRK